MQLVGGAGFTRLPGGTSRSTSRRAPDVNGVRGSIRYFRAMATAVLASAHEQLIADRLVGEEPLRSNSARPPRLLMRTWTTDWASARRPSLSSHSSPS